MTEAIRSEPIITTLVRILVASFVTLAPLLASALVSISDVGRWPENWPAELEPLRKQSRTLDVGTGIQQQIHEIRFANAAEFEKAWPAILSLKTPEAPITLYWTNSSPFKKWGGLLHNGEAAVRIHTPTYSYAGAPPYSDRLSFGSFEQLVKDGKMLKSGPPWPAEIVGTNGSLPEFVHAIETNGSWRWIPSDPKTDFKGTNVFRGFFHRARIDLEVVIDGKIIDLAKLRLPKGTPVHCDQLPVPELTGAERKALIAEGFAAFRNHVKTDIKIRRDEIPEPLWGPTMRGFKPLRVVDDRVNIKIVLAETNGLEAGFYVNLTISSKAPGYDDHHGRFVEFVQLPAPDDKAFGHIYRYKFMRLRSAVRKAE